MNRLADPSIGSICAAQSRTGASVSFDSVSKRFGSLVAVHPVTIEIAPGEFFALIGPSGSGKSTLLGMTAGFVPPSGGAIRVDGRDIVGMPPYQRNIGMVFQNYALFPHMTVAENVSFPLRMRRLTRNEISTRVRRLLAMVRLEGLEDRSPAQLSGGQQQRVALARAAVYDPGLLLMDEPLGALDKNLREEMQDEIKRFQAQLGTTVLYVTHDQQEAACMADRIAVLRAGRIEQAGSPRELYEAPANRFVASFLGEANLFELTSPTMGSPDVWHATTRQGLAVVARPTAALATSEQRPALLVRPENILLGDAATRAENRFTGTVQEVVYMAGSIRYRVLLDAGELVLARAPLARDHATFAVGDVVPVGWAAESASLVAES
jgi:putative spermidine/putrescine transport system ATP-binding protein